MSEFVTRREGPLPRLPVEGTIELTYRCNNNCRHCWLRIPPDSSERQRELTLEEITALVDQARQMGTRIWTITGGEPMLRPDFAEIFDFITRSASYSINTNGALINPRIAQLMTRKGAKAVSLYGATAEVHDHITRTPGSFDATMRGCAYLREAGANFIVQLVPMRDNYHQWDEMLLLAQSLSPRQRVGAAWLYLSARGDLEQNQEISRQRLPPQEVVRLDEPDLSFADWMAQQMEGTEHDYDHAEGDDRLFAGCIANRRDFHIDPYGQMSFCCYVKDPALRYDLRKGSFQDCWENFIPPLADQVRGGPEYLENCASCELRSSCRWCPVYGYLEHRRFSAPVEYLCAVARESVRFKENWLATHRRFYRCAGITIQVDSDLPITESTFHPKFKLFQVDGPGEDTVSIQHYFSLPDLQDRDLGEQVYRKPPWAIYRKANSWIYLGISGTAGVDHLHRLAIFNHDHTRGKIYNDEVREDYFRKGNVGALTLFPSDQVLLARLLADRQACYLHSSGVSMEGQGLVFVGHSEAGKSTMVTMLQDHAEILCDDRIVVRRWPEGLRIHGTWHHGDVPIVSASSAPLRAILFLEQAPENRLVPLEDRQEILARLLACLIRPFVTADWWENTLTVVEHVAREAPCYILRFDKSGGVVEVLEELCRRNGWEGDPKPSR